MATADNPLLAMTGSPNTHLSAEDAPNSGFVETALPGFKRALIARRSIRVFDAAPIPEDMMRDCLRDATLAPSSTNLQPYELYWVRSGALKASLAEACLGQPAATTARRRDPPS